jgi:F-type H+-transporting ATPase subunit gamma
MIRSFGADSTSGKLGTMGNISSAPTAHDSREIARVLTEAYQKGEIDAIQVLYTRFVSMISYKVTLKPIFPLKGLIEEVQHDFMRVDEGIYNKEDLHLDDTPAIAPQTLLEPNPVAVLDELVPLYLSNQLYNALLESSASELAARMTAMSNASKNAAEMIGKLTLVYNKARQAAITQEILEIVGGAEALN